MNAPKIAAWSLPTLLLFLSAPGAFGVEQLCQLEQVQAVNPCYENGDCAGPSPTGDCSRDNTNVGPWLVGGQSRTYYVPVVFHVIHLTDPGQTGKLSVDAIRCQIRALNEDYNGLPHGFPGFYTADANVRIEFFLATQAPDGSPTTGIEYIPDPSGQWFNGIYLDSPAEQTVTSTYGWDTTRYFNIYTHNGGSYSNWAWTGAPYNCPGSTFDGVKLEYRTVGRPNQSGTIGRVGVHEVGHYLGLYHPRNGAFVPGCVVCPPPDPPGCYQQGDRLCDTPIDRERNVQPPPCDNEEPCPLFAETTNFMTSRGDICVNRFTPEQAARMRCTLASVRPNLFRLSPINETTMTVTVTQFCVGNTAKIRFDITWLTPTATTGTDELRLWVETPGDCSSADCPTGPTTRIATAASGGTTHHVIWEGDCAIGNWRFVVKSQNQDGSGVIESFCRYYVLTGCGSCGGGCHPPCELE